MIALAGCLGGTGSEIVVPDGETTEPDAETTHSEGEATEPDARDALADATVAEGREPALTVYDMSGELPDTSVGFEGPGNFFEVGTVPPGEDDNGTVLIDLRPDLGPAARSVWLCIGSVTLEFVFVDCEAGVWSSGEAAQVDATGLSGRSILIRTGEGAGMDSTYALCVSVFDFQPATDDYTAIVDGKCLHPTAGEHPVFLDLVIPFYVSYSQVAQDHCASKIFELGGPIEHVNVTATWDASDRLVPDHLELAVYEGTEGSQGWYTGDALVEVRSPSPLRLDAYVAANNTVRLEICQWEVGVTQEIDVHIEGSVRYWAPAPEAAT